MSTLSYVVPIVLVFVAGWAAGRAWAMRPPRLSTPDQLTRWQMDRMPSIDVARTTRVYLGTPPRQPTSTADQAERLHQAWAVWLAERGADLSRLLSWLGQRRR